MHWIAVRYVSTRENILANITWKIIIKNVRRCAKRLCNLKRLQLQRKTFYYCPFDLFVRHFDQNIWRLSSSRHCRKNIFAIKDIRKCWCEVFKRLKENLWPLLLKYFKQLWFYFWVNNWGFPKWHIFSRVH